MADVAQRDDFWLDEDEDGNPKPVGWLFLVQDADGGGDEEDDGEESGSNFSDELVCCLPACTGLRVHAH